MQISEFIEFFCSVNERHDILLNILAMYHECLKCVRINETVYAVSSIQSSPD